jgi:hypothetical protein
VEDLMGRSHLLTVAILGAWLASTLAMWFAATRSFRTVDRVLKGGSLEFSELTRPLGANSTRLVARYIASEINRTLFWGYGALQVALGVVLFLLVWRAIPRQSLDIGLAAAMLIVAVALTLVITPMIVSLGRSIDFLSRNPPPPVMPRFWALHGSFTALDGGKLLAGIVLLIRWILR